MTKTFSAWPAWAKAIPAAPEVNALGHTGVEFPLTPLAVLEGQLPRELRGSLYRNGPARLERGGQRMGHWFDGDGAVLAVHFAEAGAIATYRYVQTSGYLAEQQANKLLFGNYGMTPPGPWWTGFGRGPKNVANTSVLALPDRLLALWEAGQPHALDLQTLETLGIDNLGASDSYLPYSAHPKVDPHTGEIFNFGVAFGRTATLKLYRSDRTGRILQQSALPLGDIPLIHDFVLAGAYLVFLISPVRLNPLPLLFNLQCPSDAFHWQPEKGTQILIVDRETLTVVSRGTTEPWFQWHFGNGATTPEGEILLTLMKHPNFQTNQRLKEVATGRIQTSDRGTFWQLRIEPQSAKVLEATELIQQGCEFPTVALQVVGQPWRYTYLSLHRPNGEEQGELYGAIACYDHHNHFLDVADCGENCYPTEPLLAPHPRNSEQGWLLTVVYNGNTGASEVWIYSVGADSSLGADGDRRSPLQESLVCRLALPNVIPMGFHGTWSAA